MDERAEEGWPCMAAEGELTRGRPALWPLGPAPGAANTLSSSSLVR